MRMCDGSPPRTAGRGRRSLPRRFPRVATTTRSRSCGMFSRRPSVRVLYSTTQRKDCSDGRSVRRNYACRHGRKFSLFVESIRTAGAWCSRAGADLVEFLAYTGCRLGEAVRVCWHDVNFGRGELVVRGDPIDRTKNGEIRRVPLIPDARGLLEHVRSLSPSARPEDKILHVRECQGAMDRAAVMVKMTRITHHDLRHLFATVCIGAGTDIPTVSRWPGHKAGGVRDYLSYNANKAPHCRRFRRTGRSPNPGDPGCHRRQTDRGGIG